MAGMGWSHRGGGSTCTSKLRLKPGTLTLLAMVFCPWALSQSWAMKCCGAQEIVEYAGRMERRSMWR